MEIRSQNRATLEAVEVSRAALEARIESLMRESQERDTLLEVAVRTNGAEIRQLQAEVKLLQGDVRGMAAKVETLGRLEERVAAIERRFD